MPYPVWVQPKCDICGDAGMVHPLVDGEADYGAVIHCSCSDKAGQIGKSHRDYDPDPDNGLRWDTKSTRDLDRTPALTYGYTELEVNDVSLGDVMGGLTEVAAGISEVVKGLKNIPAAVTVAPPSRYYRSSKNVEKPLTKIGENDVL